MQLDTWAEKVGGDSGVGSAGILLRQSVGFRIDAAGGGRYFELVSFVNVPFLIKKTKMTMIYWKSDKFWLGKILEHPEIMTYGESLQKLEENIKDAYLLMTLDEKKPEVGALK